MASTSLTTGKGRPPAPLTIREVWLARYYAESGNKLDSYRRAGFAVKNDSQACVSASYILKKPQVKALVEMLRQQAIDTALATIEEVVQGLRRAANADVRGLFGPDGEMRPPAEWPDDIVAAISGVEIDELHDWEVDPETGKKRKVKVGLTWKVRLEKKTESRKLLAQWLGMLKGTDDAKGDGQQSQQSVGVEFLARLVAAIGALQSQAERPGGTPPGGEPASPLDSLPGPAEPGVSEPG